MSRYYSPVSRQPERSWFKSAPLLMAIAIASGIFATSLYMEFSTQPAIHIRADDNSVSAKTYNLQRQIHCQASSHNYKPGDRAIAMPFADRAVVTKDINIFNSLSVLGECQHSAPHITNKEPGTPLMVLLQRGKEAIAQHRKTNNNPVVFTILANAFEPRKGQADLDFNQLHKLADEIVAERAVITIMIPPGWWQEQLTNNLQQKANICPLDESQDEELVRKSISACVDEAFAIARKLASK